MGGAKDMVEGGLGQGGRLMHATGQASMGGVMNSSKYEGDVSMHKLWRRGGVEDTQHPGLE